MVSVLVSCAVLEPVLVPCVVLEPVLVSCVVLEPVLVSCVVLEPVSCVVLEPVSCAVLEPVLVSCVVQRHWQQWAHKTQDEDEHDTKTQHRKLKDESHQKQGVNLGVREG